MGIFTQKPEEPGEWLGLPSEPFERDEATDLPEAPVADPLGLGLGVTSAASIVVPVAVPVPVTEADPATDQG